MRKDLLTACIAIVVLTVLLGGVYPLVVTGIGQVAFSGPADGTQVERDGTVVGSEIIGQEFTRPVIGRDGEPEVDEEGEPVLEPDRRYVQSRPSVTGYDPAATAFANAGPNSQDQADAIAERADAYLALERPFDHTLERGDIPVDAVTVSASSVDPHISRDNAEIQAARIARVRGIDRARVDELIDEHTDGRGLGLLGEPGVNVLALNLAIDAEATR
jgi:potassium-transporting ATPase KdpC subunit